MDMYAHTTIRPKWIVYILFIDLMVLLDCLLSHEIHLTKASVAGGSLSLRPNQMRETPIKSVLTHSEIWLETIKMWSSWFCLFTHLNGKKESRPGSTPSFNSTFIWTISIMKHKCYKQTIYNKININVW